MEVIAMNKLESLVDLKFKEYRIEYWEKFGRILDNEEGTS